ncbi:MAG: family 10 glycosylhydrolase [Clostridia bacterium]|nr:family 10 glycosylhydrolase [Clostridia bacterium]
MKRLFQLTILFLVLVGCVVCYSGGYTPLDFLDILLHPSEPEISDTENSPNVAPESQISTASETRGVWVATAYCIDYPSAETTEEAELKEECDHILDNIQANGGNTVYLQVRPAADSLYPSSLFPWSRYLTGSCGTAPEHDFDPLEYWVQQAHARGLKLEAWVNPYRICAGEHAQSDFAALPSDSPAKQHPEWVVECDGSYYFNPGLEDVRQLICDGVTEIVKNYDVDGIQFDDYFYPSTEFDDKDTYSSSNTELSIADWRRDNVNQLVQQVGEAVHQNARNMNCQFGISPSGIWRNKGINSFGGSDTNGYEHYTSSYADSLTWITNGWIDYICPQIYWQIGDEAADFETLANWWSRQVMNTDVKLILGLATYKIEDSTYGSVWEKDGCAEIGRQIDLARSLSDIDGFAIFSYRDLTEKSGLDDVLKEKWAG